MWYLVVDDDVDGASVGEVLDLGQLHRLVHDALARKSRVSVQENLGTTATTTTSVVVRARGGGDRSEA